MLRPDTFALTALLALLTALGPVAVDMYLPSFPEIGRLLGASPATVQLTLSLYMVSYAIGQVVYGPLSDRWGRIPVLRAALAIYCVASLACALAPTIETLLAARAFQALGSSGAIVLARAIVRDLYSGARAGRELSLMGAIMALAPVGAPMIGGVLQTAFGWRSHFVLQIAFGLIAAFFVWRKLPETLRAQTPGPFSLRRDLGRLPRDHAQPRGARLCGHAVDQLRGRVRLDLRLVLRAAGDLRPFGARIRARLRGGERAAISPAPRSRRASWSRVGLDRTIGIGCARACGRRNRGRCGASRSAAHRRSRWSRRWRSTPSAWGWLQPQTIAGAMMPFPHRAGTASSLVGVSQMVCAAIVRRDRRASAGSERMAGRDPARDHRRCHAALWALSRGVRARDAAHPHH